MAERGGKPSQPEEARHQHERKKRSSQVRKDQQSDSDKFEISSPTKEMLERSSMKDLREVWRGNHLKLQKIYQEMRPPFFGLHGTSQENFRKIIATERGHVQIATFYERSSVAER